MRMHSNVTLYVQCLSYSKVNVMAVDSSKSNIKKLLTTRPFQFPVIIPLKLFAVLSATAVTTANSTDTITTTSATPPHNT